MNATTQPILAPQNVDDVIAAVRGGARLLPRGGGSKPALSTGDGSAAVLETRALSGIVEYNPGEFTFTAQAGTPLAEIAATLAEHGQRLPFDPPLVEAGATVGGAIASGLSGPGRQRYGGLRDFILGVRFVDGQGQLVRGGGKVVKNAAGFDLPKLMVDSLGRLGILVEASFKVFPLPAAWATVRAEFATLAAACDALARLAVSRFDVEALDLTPYDHAVYVRIGGLPAVLPGRAQRIVDFLGAGSLMAEAEDADFWRAGRECTWAAPGAALAKVPLSLHSLPALDAALDGAGAARRYSVGGALAWVAWPGDPAALDALLQAQGLSGLLIRGQAATPFLGAPPERAFYSRVKRALDPHGKFLD